MILFAIFVVSWIMFGIVNAMLLCLAVFALLSVIDIMINGI